MIRADFMPVGIPAVENGKHRDFHSLRHGFVSELWRTGASAAVVRELARHADIRTTQMYSHTSMTEKAAAIARLPAVPKGPSSAASEEEQDAA